jgi:hypothetical protein
MLPQELGCGSRMPCWRRVRDWQQAGKRHLICDGQGVPLAVRLTGANRNDLQEARVGGCDSAAARRTRAIAATTGLRARGSRLRRGGDSA